MSTNKYIDRICCAVLALALLVTFLFMNGEGLGLQAAESSMAYEQKLFDASVVHSIDIEMDDWEGFLETCTDEEYVTCAVVIDNEVYKNVGIRAKGNTSLSSVQSYGNDRYSFKIEFDHYDSGESYYGLDKLCLNNIIQDHTYMKDYLCYQMMKDFGVNSPLCSFAYITVNGEDWGLYLAVEGVEESFLQRNYGSDYGELYKPDSTDMGGGRGNGQGFDMEQFQENFQNSGNIQEGKDVPGGEDAQSGGGSQTMENMPPGGFPESDFPDSTGMPESGEPPEDTSGARPGGMGGMNGTSMGAGGGMSMGSDDVSLIYTDDAYSSYSNIFDNAKTDITDSDKDRLIASIKQLNQGTNIEEVVNLEEVIRYFVVHNFVCNFDSYTGSMIHNYYLYEEDGVLSMIPWDYNLAFGGFLSGSDANSLVNYPIDTPVSGGSISSRPMLAWIFADEEYTELYHEYFAEFIQQYFESGYFENLIDSVSAMIAPYVEQDPTKFCTYEEFLTGVETLKEFCLLRAESVSGQLSGTIPSTSEEQNQDSSALIDASSISVSDMGSMGNTMGGFSGSEMPDGSAQFGEEFFSDSGDRSFPEDMGRGGAEPDMSTSAQATGQDDVWLLLVVSIILLAGGMAFAFRFKSRVAGPGAVWKHQ